MIAQSELVESLFGYWPEFCDGHIECLSLERLGVVSLSILYIDAGLKKSALISLRFAGVTELELFEVRSTNVIDTLAISATSPYVVSIEACYGMEGTFKCTTVEVTSVVPNSSFKADGCAAA